MTASADVYRLRPGPAISGRRFPEAGNERMRGLRDRAEAVGTEPFTGITTDGAVVPDLFPLRRTGVSTQPIKEAAEAFLVSLPDAQQGTARFPIDSPEWMRWLNIHPFITRHGVLLDELNAAQREAALAVLEASLSATGFDEARNVMRLNETIAEMANNWDAYGEWLYWMSLFGTPSADQPWGWQIDGHHLNVNCFVLGDQVVMTPTFMGSEPVEAPMGRYAGTRVLAAEEQTGLELIRALTPQQQDTAILFRTITSTDLPPGRFRGADGRVQGGAFQDNIRLPYEGLRCDDLSPAQQSLLLRLVETYVGRMRPGHAELKMAEVKHHLADTHFAWMGGIDEDSVFYYRIHSPMLLIEFDHESGVAFEHSEPTRTHIHTVIRTPNGNDYGKDLLRQHYEQYHRAPKT
ncbi:MAG: DUF3500 domain-containing protein [Dehalococcoidia bacterium]